MVFLWYPFLLREDKHSIFQFPYLKQIKRIDKKHPLFPEVSDSRGVAYERIGKWDKAEKDLLASLEVSPDQAYVINYLAYSWIEQGVKIEQSLSMLEKASFFIKRYFGRYVSVRISKFLVFLFVKARARI